MLNKTIKLDFHDLRICPKPITTISSRSSVDPYYLHDNLHKFLPLFTAPMDTVVSYYNSDLFVKNKINTIIPRGDTSYEFGVESCFKSLGLDEFINEYINISEYGFHFKAQYKNYVLIDIANGHMQKLLCVAKEAKKKYGDKLVLMVGNIANVETYKLFAEIGIDYCRCGIGNGAGCLTTKQLSVGYPMASLIMECYDIKQKNGFNTKIVADGGMKEYSDIILALALGADYVMIGSIFNKCLESCGDTYLFDIIKINQYSNFAKWLFKKKYKLTKKFRGMSTKEVQRKWNKTVIKTSEGVSKKQKVEYTLQQWVENFEDYLKSTMSYSDAKNLKEFIGKADIIQISNKSYDRFDK
jgi:IMP dehydrogenase/GMP reductase